MSAYVVSTKTIDRILSGLHHMKRQTQSYPSDHYYQFMKEINPTNQTLTAIGKKLLSTNILAVCQRYKGDTPKEYEGQLQSFTHRANGVPTPIQFFKDIRCLIYQCSEGNIPDVSAVYKDLENLASAISQVIVQNMPEYDTCKWD